MSGNKTMLALILIIGLSSALAAPLDTHALIMAAVDKTFGDVDTNHDGLIDLTELLVSYTHVDLDGDGRVSEAEFESRSTNHTYTRLVFLQLDYDHDGFLDESAVDGQYAVMDTSADNIVSRSEFDAYYAKVMEDAIARYGHLVGLAPIQN